MWRDKYGADHVAQIITFGTMAARGVLRDVGRVMGMSYPEVDRIAKMVPFALDMTLERALKQNPELHAAYETEERVRELIDTAQKLEGMPRHASTHAAGVLITPKPVSDYVPLQTNDDGDHHPVPHDHAGIAGPFEDGLPGPAHAQRDRRQPGYDARGRQGRYAARGHPHGRSRRLRADRQRRHGRYLPVGRRRHAPVFADHAAGEF